jgi:hypothetical protein
MAAGQSVGFTYSDTCSQLNEAVRIQAVMNKVPAISQSLEMG